MERQANDSPFIGREADDRQAVIDTNLTGSLLMAGEVLLDMIAAGRDTIVNITSTAAHT